MKIYLYRRKGNVEYATCDRSRYVALSQHRAFETMVCETVEPTVERQDNSALMKIAADLANRRPLDQLYRVCDTQSRISCESLHEYLDKAGDLLAGIALDIRLEITK